MFELHSGLQKKFFPTHSQGCPENIDVAQVASSKIYKQQNCAMHNQLPH